MCNSSSRSELYMDHIICTILRDGYLKIATFIPLQPRPDFCVIFNRWFTINALINCERNTSACRDLVAAAIHAMIWTQHVQRCVWWGLELLLDSPRDWLIRADAALWLSASKPWRRATRECVARPLSTSLMCGIVATRLFYRTFFTFVLLNKLIFTEIVYDV